MSFGKSNISFGSTFLIPFLTVGDRDIGWKLDRWWIFEMLRGLRHHWIQTLEWRHRNCSMPTYAMGRIQWSTSHFHRRHWWYRTQHFCMESGRSHSWLRRRNFLYLWQPRRFELLFQQEWQIHGSLRRRDILESQNSMWLFPMFRIHHIRMWKDLFWHQKMKSCVTYLSL